MGIADQRDALRCQADGHIDRAHHVGLALPRQPVHQIEVDGAAAGGAQPIHGLGDQRIGLHPVDGVLDGLVEILHAEADAGHPGGRQREAKTAPVGIVTELIEGDIYRWGSLMAGALFGSLPIAILYSFFVQHYVSSMTGAIKD